VLISFEDGASLAMKTGEESNSKQPNPNTMPVPKPWARCRELAVMEFCGAVTPSGWHSAGSVLDEIGRMKSGRNRKSGQIDEIVVSDPVVSTQFPAARRACSNRY